MFLKSIYIIQGQFNIRLNVSYLSYKKTSANKGGFFCHESKSYFFDFDLEEEVFLLVEAVFLVEQEELQQDLVALEP